MLLRLSGFAAIFLFFVYRSCQNNNEVMKYITGLKNCRQMESFLNSLKQGYVAPVESKEQLD